MNRPTTSFESELRMSPKPVLAAMLAVGCLPFLLTQITSSSWEVVNHAGFFYLAVSGLSVLGWLLFDRKPLVGRWFTVLALLTAVHLANRLFDLPGSLTLTAMSVALAVPLISLPAAIITAVGESLVLVILTKYPAARLDWPFVITALVGVWGMVGVTYAANHPKRRLGDWLEEYFERAQRLLEEARDRKQELEEALKNLAHSNRQLALANDRMASLRMIAEQLQRSKAAFVANVSHEFRTPLNMIIGLVDVMVETPELYAVALSPKMRADLEIVHRNCEHLASMINDVLDLTRTEMGRLALRRERVDLEKIIDRCVAAVLPLVEKKRLALRVIVPEDLPQIQCDRVRIQQVILNLLSNAARFTEEGGITVELAMQDHSILASVVDTGQGISPEDVERIFEPFSQGSRYLWSGKGGSGLGLSISEQFVRLHGGQMWLESEPGVGSSFFFSLPISPPKRPSARPGHWIRQDWMWREDSFKTGLSGSSDDLVRPRAVICDESAVLWSEFTRYSNEVEFVDARDMTQVLGELRRSPAHVVVLNAADSDETWPLIDKAVQMAPGTPIVVCSVPRLAQRAIDAGALGHLIKPVTRADLEKAIQATGRPVRRVLVVDDDPEVLQLFDRMLRICDNDLDVVTASSGAQALEELRREAPDLMLLDVVMPELDGWQILEQMREDGSIKEVPTYFVSAQDPAEQLPATKFFLATMDGGLSLSQLLRCSLEVSKVLLKPEEALDQALG